jgi:osmotically-inducible protein OsmY
MSTASITGTDVRLRGAVVRELDWDPEVDAGAIGVSAKDGVVTLSGFIGTYAGKLAAERVAKRVRGVRAVANDIVVRLLVDRTDADVAHDAAQALKLRPAFAETVQAVVHKGHVTLTGTVEWLFQKQQAEEAVRHLRGVAGVLDHIEVARKSGVRDIQRRIVRALHVSTDLDARQISVTVHGDVVTLKGTVHSWMQREAAERAAASAPGIARVQNDLVVAAAEPPELDPADEIC